MRDPRHVRLPHPPWHRRSASPVGTLGFAIGKGMSVVLVLASILSPDGTMASAPRDRRPIAPTPGPALEMAPRRTAPVPLFAGPAILEISGRDGTYTWDEVRFGADQVLLSATIQGGQRPCGMFLALDDAAADDLLASEVVTTGPHEVASNESSVVVDYATAALRLVATCPEWTLRVEPVADPDLVYDVEELSYPVRGRTIRELAAQANQAQDGWAAYADWRTDWRFSWLESGVSCDVMHGEVELRATITYPAWRPPAGVSPGVADRWGRFMDDLTIHELGHITIALQGADAIDELLDGGVTAATCAEAERAADRAASRLHDRFERINRRYDESTDHGVAQGAGLP